MDEEACKLADALAGLGRAIRDAVLALPVTADDHLVVRREGGDDVFGLDERADTVVRDGIVELGRRWPGHMIVEGFEEPIVVGDRAGPWVYLADPLDGTRLWLAGKRSAWVLLGAGRHAQCLEDLEVGAAVEVPGRFARAGLVAWAGDGQLHVVAEEAGGANPEPVSLAPQQGPELERRYVSVPHYTPGGQEAIGKLADRLLDGLGVFSDAAECTGAYLMGLASSADAAVLDPRPLLGAPNAAHPYDLAALVVARTAGAIIEALPPGPLTGPLHPWTEVAWAGYANPAVADALRRRWWATAAGPDGA